MALPFVRIKNLYIKYFKIFKGLQSWGKLRLPESNRSKLAASEDMKFNEIQISSEYSLKPAMCFLQATAKVFQGLRQP